MHRRELPQTPLRRVLAHAPQQLPERLLAVRAGRLADRRCRTAHLLAAHLVHRGIGQRNHVETVVTDLSVRQRLGNTLGVSGAHADAGMLDTAGISAMGTQIIGKGLQRLVVAARAGEQQPLGLEVMHDGDIRVPALDAGLIDADMANARHIVFRTGCLDVVTNPPPQALGRHPKLIGRLANGKLPAQRQTQRLEQQGKAAAFARPRHRHLRRLAAAAALDARHLGVQPRFELKEVQVPPATVHAVVDQLMLGPAPRTDGPLAGVFHLEVDAALGRVEFDLGDVPRRLQAERGGEEGFDLATHHVRRLGQVRGIEPPIVMFVEKSISTGNGIEPPPDGNWCMEPVAHQRYY